MTSYLSVLKKDFHCNLQLHSSGILTGKFAKEIEFAAGDHRKYTVLFDKELWPLVYEGVENLKNIAENSAGLFLNWPYAGYYPDKGFQLCLLVPVMALRYSQM